MTATEQAQYARFYDQIYGGYLKEEVETLLPFPACNEVLSVIDLGCGTGQQLANIAKRNTNPASYFLGLDNNEGMIVRARGIDNSNGRLEFKCESFLKPLKLAGINRFHPGADLYFTCLGNTLALVSDTEYENIADFIFSALKQASLKKAVLFLELRDSLKYREWMGDGRLELLNYEVSEENMLLSFQTVQANESSDSLSTEGTDTYSAKIYSICKNKTNAEFYFIQEPNASFVKLSKLFDAFSSKFNHEQNELPVRSGLTEGKVLKVLLEIKE